MRITIHKCSNSIHLRDAIHGDVVQFCGALHNKHEHDDYFIVNEVCSTYRPERHLKRRSYASAAIALTNLRTGSLAYLDPDREIIAIDCELQLC